MQSRMKLLSSTALVAAAMVMAVPTASAQDIGALEKRVKALEKSGGGQNIARSKKTMRLVISGHIFRLVQLRDNGTKSGILHVTGAPSASRVRWVADGKINEDLSVRTNIELGNNTNLSSAASLGSNANVDGDSFSDRFIDLVVTSRSMGRLYLGQGSPAADGISETDLSGTGLMSLSGNAGLLSAAEEFQTDSVGGRGSGVTVGSVFTNIDGGRQDRLRYDTPSFSGFVLSAAHGTGDYWDAGLRYGGSLGGVSLAARLGYIDTQTTNGVTSVNGSVSVLLPMGLSLTVGGADRDDTDGGASDQTRWRYGKVGYMFKGSELGQTRLWIDYNSNKDVARLDEDSRYWSMGVVQILEPLGMEFTIAYVNFDVDLASGAQTDDIDVFSIGLRAAF